VGRHSAPAGASADPIVADALAHRASGPAAVHSADGPRAAEESGVGWPAPAREGDGLGWPEDATVARAAEEPSGPMVRRNWRRLFRPSPAA
jgi:hypothetical protein